MIEDKNSITKEQWFEAVNKYAEKKADRYGPHYTKEAIRSEIKATIYMQIFYHFMIFGFFYYIGFFCIMAYQEELEVFLFLLPLFIVCFLWELFLESLVLRSLTSQIKQIKRMKKHKIMEEN